MPRRTIDLADSDDRYLDEVAKAHHWTADRVISVALRLLKDIDYRQTSGVRFLEKERIVYYIL